MPLVARPVEKSGTRIEKSPQEWTAAVKAFALTHEGDLVGVAPMDPLYIYEGYELTHPWVVVIGVSMEHGELDHLPPPLENTSNPVEVARQYNRAARACRELNNFILSLIEAKAWQGPFASALNMMPAAIKRGSAIRKTRLTHQ